MEFIKELYSFLKYRKKLWLTPILIVTFGIGGLLIIANGSIFAPFIYSVF